jgi:imidazolonepropionase-like amidohydrolase
MNFRSIQRWLVVALAPVLACMPPPKPRDPVARALVFRHVRLFDGTSVQPDVTVVVRDGVVLAVGPRAEVPSSALVVDGSGDTLLPGLIDAHVHLWQRRQLEEAIVLGVTTELDMMTMPRMAQALKEQQRDDPNLADLRTAGNPVTCAGGHGTEYGFPVATISGAADADLFVAARVRDGSDYLKIMYTPGAKRYPSIDDATLLACARVARARGLRTVVHIESLDGAMDALTAGVSGLAHLFRDRVPPGTFGDAVAASGAFVIPTLSVLVPDPDAGAWLARDPALAPYLDDEARRTLAARSPFRPPESEAERAAAQAVVLESIRQLLAARVPILAGTDAPNAGTAHGASLHGELERLVRAGLTPIQAMVAATAAPAAVFGLQDRGRIAPGLRADLLLVRGDPTTDIRSTRQILGVWKRGLPVDRDATRRRVSEERRPRLQAPPAPPAN